MNRARTFGIALALLSWGLLIALSLSGCAAGLAGIGAAVIEPVVEGAIKGMIEGLKAPPPGKESRRTVCEPYTPNDPNYCLHFKRGWRGAAWHYEA